jgi:predicted PurR-regulated permease PerM
MDSYQEDRRFAQRVLAAAGIVLGVVLLVYFLNLLVDVLLLTFAGVLLSVSIDGVRQFIQHHLPISRVFALILTFVLVLLATAVVLVLIVPQAAEQVPRLIEQLPEALRQLGDLARRTPGLEAALEGSIGGNGDGGNGFDVQAVLMQIGGAFSTAVGAIGSVLLILVIGFYIVLDPGKYAEHLVRLFPKTSRARVGQLLALQAKALRLWLLSRLISMVFVGVVTAVGLSLLGVPMAFALGLISGLLTFIPYLGPVLAAIPTGLVALLVEPRLALFALLFYVVVETVESNVVAPLAAKTVVHLPPAYTVIIQIAGGVVAGLPGVILATPLAVAALVAVQTLYLQDTLGDEVAVLGAEKRG